MKTNGSAGASAGANSTKLRAESNESQGVRERQLGHNVIFRLFTFPFFSISVGSRFNRLVRSNACYGLTGVSRTGTTVEEWLVLWSACARIWPELLMRVAPWSTRVPTGASVLRSVIEPFW